MAKITIEAAAIQCSVAQRSVRRWIADGQLPAYRLGPRLVRIDTDDLDAMFTRIPTVGRADSPDAA
jgi:excisionase family DNA binding protein